MGQSQSNQPQRYAVEIVPEMAFAIEMLGHPRPETIIDEKFPADFLADYSDDMCVWLDLDGEKYLIGSMKKTYAAPGRHPYMSSRPNTKIGYGHYDARTIVDSLRRKNSDDSAAIFVTKFRKYDDYYLSDLKNHTVCKKSLLRNTPLTFLLEEPTTQNTSTAPEIAGETA